MDQVWGDDKPPMPNEKVWILDNKYTGQDTVEKCQDISKKLPKDCDMLLVTALDDIAWLLNLRGTDIDYNPVFFSYLILHRNGDNFKMDLFINKDKVSEHEV